MLQRIFGLFFVITYVHAFIVPQEVPSLLSLVYSNIPPIKKGTDSRVGFGYRLGEHADFQVLFELGPQTNTKPIGSAASDDDSDTSKRNVDQSDYVFKNSPNPEGSEWLSNWSHDMKSQTKVVAPKPVPHVHTAPKLQTAPFISESALKQLQKLYEKANTQNNDQSTIPDSIGTLPAIAMDDVVMKLHKENRKQNFIPNTVRQLEHQTSADKSKITAELMDVDLD
ncbi:hypothetical protein Bhyg_04455 [Pseudolycoriella hygida]|uniref:Secreted protein n=1 Tax=Pseudolycoriella hygida TaxID=35572 RepID=A0A9Q0NGF0_9DIPT|nr:hypothetical protein Bhyg_04455 [Pseudolycoriella hygida]